MVDRPLISGTDASGQTLGADGGSGRLLIVSDQRDLAGRCRDLFPDLRVLQVPSYLAGIAELSSGSVAGLLVAADRPAGRLGPAVAGLREAAGPNTRIVLCCAPAYEPHARATLPTGADDYLIYPPQPGELSEALGLSEPPPAAENIEDRRASPPLDELATLIDRLELPRHALLGQMAELAQRWLAAAGVAVVVGRAQGKAGVPGGGTVLAEPIFVDGAQAGQLSVGPRQAGSYQHHDARLLRDLADAFGRLLHSADRLWYWRGRAMRDDLTGLGNLAQLRAALAEQLPRAGERRSRLTLVYLEVGGLESYDERVGSTQAEEVVRELARLLCRGTRSYDLCCRVAEDQFAVLLADQEPCRVRGSQHPCSGVEFLWRLRDAVLDESIPGLGRSAPGGLGLHAGLASYPWDSRSPEGLLRKARQALRDAKGVGSRCLALTGPRAGQLLHTATLPTSPADSSVFVSPDEPQPRPAS